MGRGASSSLWVGSGEAFDRRPCSPQVAFPTPRKIVFQWPVLKHGARSDDGMTDAEVRERQWHDRCRGE